jgi:hypothetical protein
MDQEHQVLEKWDSHWNWGYLFGFTSTVLWSIGHFEIHVMGKVLAGREVYLIGRQRPYGGDGKK